MPKSKSLKMVDDRPDSSLPAPMTPGIGVAGEVLCPIMSIGRIGGAPCIKNKCEFWVELTYGSGTPDERRVARCALSWLPVLSTEITEAIKKLAEA